MWIKRRVTIIVAFHFIKHRLKIGICMLAGLIIVCSMLRLFFGRSVITLPLFQLERSNHTRKKLTTSSKISIWNAACVTWLKWFSMILTVLEVDTANYWVLYSEDLGFALSHCWVSEVLQNTIAAKSVSAQLFEQKKVTWNNSNLNFFNFFLEGLNRKWEDYRNLNLELSQAK